MDIQQQNQPLFPTLITDRLLLRKLETNDTPEIFNLRSDDRVNEYLDRPKAASLTAAKAFIEMITTMIDQNKSFYWAISLKESHKLIGTICLWNIDTGNLTIETGYEMMPAHQGKGLMQEALLAVIDFAFKTLRFKTIVACPIAANERSVKLLERNGFITDGVKAAGGELVYSLKSPLSK
jgi:[ribosomal protein S5]-alanine N-acetyltransferase